MTLDLNKGGSFSNLCNMGSIHLCPKLKIRSRITIKTPILINKSLIQLPTAHMTFSNVNTFH